MMVQEIPGTGLEIREIRNALQAEVIVDGHLDAAVTGIYASDLMSDVLAYGKAGSCLLTGLNSVQAVISSYMAEFKAVVFLRGKKPKPEICTFAREKKLAILSTSLDMYEACVGLSRGHTGDFTGIGLEEKNVTRKEYIIDGSDFASAGLVSTNIKSVLKEIGYEMPLIRRVAISVYEGEMNVVMHAKEASVFFSAGDREIVIVIDDRGKGIPDIRMALQEGFSTATEEQRAMGFGAGMGLPNIKRNSDHIGLTSKVGKGTRLEMKFNVTR